MIYRQMPESPLDEIPLHPQIEALIRARRFKDIPAALEALQRGEQLQDAPKPRIRRLDDGRLERED